MIIQFIRPLLKLIISSPYDLNFLMDSLMNYFIHFNLVTYNLKNNDWDSGNAVKY